MSFDGLEVAAFESRRADAMARLIEAHGGLPVSAPCVRQLPLEPGPDAIELVRRVRDGEVDGVLFLTPGGVRALPVVLEPILPIEDFVAHLANTTVAGRGPKTVEALTELGVADPVASGPPHTSTELVAAFAAARSVGGASLAVIEHGAHHGSLRADLMDRGAEKVLPVAVYRWALPDDVRPLTQAIEGIAEGQIRVALFTNSAQIDAAIGVAAELDLDEPLVSALEDGVVGAVGPVCARRLSAFGVKADVVPDEPTMGSLVRAVAARVQSVLQEERGS